jgi:hypothetical protein
MFPWGSLLRGVLGLDARVLAGVAALLRPGAAAVALFSIVPRDGVPSSVRVDAYRDAGLSIVSMRPACAEEVAASGSSWAKRLRAGSERPVERIEFQRATARACSTNPAAPVGNHETRRMPFGSV